RGCSLLRRSAAGPSSPRSAPRPACTFSFFLIPLPPTPRSTPFPYTTLFRSSITMSCLTGVWQDKRHPALASRLVKWLSSVGSIEDRKSTRLNSSHVKISYAVFCLKKKSDIQALNGESAALTLSGATFGRPIG